MKGPLAINPDSISSKPSSSGPKMTTCSWLIKPCKKDPKINSSSCTSRRPEKKSFLTKLPRLNIGLLLSSLSKLNIARTSSRICVGLRGTRVTSMTQSADSLPMLSEKDMPLKKMRPCEKSDLKFSKTSEREVQVSGLETIARSRLTKDRTTKLILSKSEDYRMRLTCESRACLTTPRASSMKIVIS